MTEIQYLTIDHVIEFHDETVRELGGLDGIRSRHKLAAAVMQPQQSAFGEDAYPTIPDKAAAYGFFIAEAQAFIDGNKRAAAMAMLASLDLNGYELLPRRRRDRADVRGHRLTSHRTRRVLRVGLQPRSAPDFLIDCVLRVEYCFQRRGTPWQRRRL